jgi:hypothetical protein
MWVAELGCAQGHGFEGWFGSRADFDSQRQRGLVSCPQCGSADVERRLTAPRLNLGALPSTEPAPGAAPTPPSAPGGAVVAPVVAAAAQLREFMARLHARAEDVGQRFAEEARRIHAQEAPERAIRGQATAGEVEALLEDGIDVLPLPFDGTEPLVH